MAAELYAGVGKAEIRFPEGYFPNAEFTAMYAPSHVRVLKIESDENVAAIAVFELPSVRPWEYTEQLRTELSVMLGVPREAAWVCMTHSLSAPHVPKEPEKQIIHLQALHQAMNEAVIGAVESREQVQIGYGVTTSDVNVNRDVQSVDGWWVGISTEGISDKDVTYIRLDTIDGKCKVVLFSYGLKSSCLEGLVLPDGRKLCTPDVCGSACRAIEEASGAVAIFLMSAAGDQVPKKKASYLKLDENGRFYPVMLGEEAFQICEELGKELASDVLRALDEKVPMYTQAQIGAKQLTMMVDGKMPYPKTLSSPPVQNYTYQSAPQEQVEVYLIQIGMAWLLGLKAEVTTPIFQAIREKVNVPFLLAATLVNGGQGYFATDLDYERFTYPGLNTMFAKGADQVLVDTIEQYFNNI